MYLLFLRHNGTRTHFVLSCFSGSHRLYTDVIERRIRHYKIRTDTQRDRHGWIF